MATPKIALALSGGGMRAYSFHCGTLKRLAETGRMEQVSHISSVSGGSLLTGLIYDLHGRWPGSREFLDEVFPKLRDNAINRNLQKRALLAMANPANWRYLFSRANIVRDVLEDYWGINGSIDSLPDYPKWSVNGTTGETGRRFGFSRERCGDYEIGYTDSKPFSISTVMAVSAAFPGGVGPLAIKSADYTWRKGKTYDTPESEWEAVKLPFGQLHLYDGGVYDNLGTEAIFDVGTQQIKADASHIVVSDAGSPFTKAATLSFYNPLRLMRLYNITADQARAVRVRALSNFIKTGAGSGAYVQLGTDARSRIEKYASQAPERAERLLAEEWVGGAALETARSYPTNLKNVAAVDFDLLVEHGYQTLYWSEYLFYGI